MERLTARNSDGIAVYRQSYQCERCGETFWRLPNLGNGSPTDRLTGYEDLEEQCNKENYFSLRMLLQKWKEFFEDIHELYECRKLEEQGELLKLPCAVGDTVYVLAECENIPEQLDGTLWDSDGHHGTATGYYCPYENNCPFPPDDDCDTCEKCEKTKAVFEDTVESITIAENGVWINTENCRIYSQIGFHVFLSKEEAENALGKLQM